MDVMLLLGITEVMEELKVLLLPQIYDLMEWQCTGMSEKIFKFEAKLVFMDDLLEESWQPILQITQKTLIF